MNRKLAQILFVTVSILAAAAWFSWPRESGDVRAIEKIIHRAFPVGMSEASILDVANRHGWRGVLHFSQLGEYRLKVRIAEDFSCFVTLKVENNRVVSCETAVIQK